jgi:kynurenine formamidase
MRDRGEVAMIDLSHRLDQDSPVYPNYPRVEVTVLDATERAAIAGRRRLNSSQVRIGLHCGTHMDAPFHFFGDGTTIDAVELDRCVGAAALVRLANGADDVPIEPSDLAPAEAAIRMAGRVIINTGWHHRWGAPEYFDAHPVLSGAAARYLVDLGVHLVGIDTPSVDRAPFEAHLALLGNDVLIVENLTNLDAIERDLFTFAALPLPLRGRDGSPVRAVALDC